MGSFSFRKESVMQTTTLTGARTSLISLLQQRAKSKCINAWIKYDPKPRQKIAWRIHRDDDCITIFLNTRDFPQVRNAYSELIDRSNASSLQGFHIPATNLAFQAAVDRFLQKEKPAHAIR
jgi:hypothetical protein